MKSEVFHLQAQCWAIFLISYLVVFFGGIWGLEYVFGNHLGFVFMMVFPATFAARVAAEYWWKREVELLYKELGVAQRRLEVQKEELRRAKNAETDSDGRPPSFWEDDEGS